MTEPTTQPESATPQQESPTDTQSPQQPQVSQTSMSSPIFVPSRPVSPTPSLHGSVGRPSPQIRRPSSSLSSRRASMLSPPDSNLPQRLPRSSHPVDAAAFAELHQELEAEQEAQVNRLLNLIRIQSLQQSGNSVDGDATSNAATIDSSSTRPGGRMSRRGSNRLSRDGSYYRPRSVSRASSPGLAAGADSASESSAWIASPSDAGYYAAESQMLKRENEMLKRRIRELEKMVTDLSGKISGSSPTVPAEPASVESEPVKPT